MRAYYLPALAGLALVGCAHSPAYDPQDPLERVNRATYAFNEYVDYFGFRPLARGYEWIMPDVGRQMVRNFFGNLFYPSTILSDLLQAKWAQGGNDLVRLGLNSTLGLGGLLDVATGAGFPKHQEDFGQVLGHWGVGQGWYLMVPFLGPSANRDAVGSVGGYFTNPLVYHSDPWYLSWVLGALDTVENRAQLIGTDTMLAQQLDRYVAVRTFYLERRHYLVHDGNPPPEDFDFDDED